MVYIDHSLVQFKVFSLVPGGRTRSRKKKDLVSAANPKMCGTILVVGTCREKTDGIVETTWKIPNGLAKHKITEFWIDLPVASTATLSSSFIYIGNRARGQ